MELFKTPLKDCYILKPKIFEDSRGFFFESFNEKLFEDLTGVNVHFVQDNESFSTYGVLRGLHFQKEVYAQAKLVRVIQGEVLDVAVDLRPGSPTFHQWFSIILSEENKKQFFNTPGVCTWFCGTLRNSKVCL